MSADGQKGRQKGQGDGHGDGYDPLTIAIGVLGKPHGVRGEIALRIFNASGSGLGTVDSLIVERDGQRVRRALKTIRPCANGFLVRFEGIDSREAASTLTLSRVRVPRDTLPPPAPGEYYVSDVIGCEVFAETGSRLGVVEETFWNGAHDLMVVRGEGDREHLIPLVPEFVREVDVTGRKIQVAWEGEEEGE
jgi:16S rRNA processing protein RimM